ncbi:hypothetical protein [Caproicibacter sp. BJN0012]|uniref:hypothetical protein n=1 Tax=Caproicibacter sp. BJN0012 TaxID=3110227 RepID=UPI002E144C07
MNALTNAFYEVMYKYRLCFSAAGVETNLSVWRQNKEPLLRLLRQHPGWNEEELAIVFDLSERREINRDSVDENKFELLLLSEQIDMTQEQREDFHAALDAATADYACVPHEDKLETIRQRGRIKCAPGQKASRIINKLCLALGFDRYEIEKVQSVGDGAAAPTVKMVKPYNAVFARLADSLNPVVIPKTGILSIHPCDFLEMSNRDDSWHSCHCLADGGWKGGCQSYMGDGVSMIFFTVDEDVHSDFHKAPRITREIFCYNDGLLLQSRLYPANDADTRDLYRSLIQGAIAKCLDAPNLWITKKELGEIQGYWETAENSLHYPDYDNGYATLSFLKGWGEYGHLLIGSPSHCLCCGQIHTNNNRLKCGCDPVVVCKSCGETVPEPQSNYLDGAFYCNNCVHTCAACGRLIRDDMYPAFDRSGQRVEICQDCYTAMMETCSRCSVHTACTAFHCNPFCPHTELFQAA